MARQKAKLRLRPTDGMLEDVTIALPVSWAAGLRERADKLGLSIESVVVQLCGHAASELGQLHKVFPHYAGRAHRGATVADDNLCRTVVVVENASKSLSRHDGASVLHACRQRCDELVVDASSPSRLLPLNWNTYPTTMADSSSLWKGANC